MSDITLLRQQLQAADRKLHQMRLSARLPGQTPCDLTRINLHPFASIT